MSMNRNEERSLTGAAPVTVNSRHGGPGPAGAAPGRGGGPSAAEAQGSYVLSARPAVVSQPRMGRGPTSSAASAPRNQGRRPLKSQ